MEGELPNIKKGIVLSPVYINSKKTVAEGRRIGLSKIGKAYPRDFMQRGRVRALLKEENGTLYNPSIRSIKSLMLLRVAEMVPRHHGRAKKLEPASTSAGSPNKSGKGGKKKR